MFSGLGLIGFCCIFVAATVGFLLGDVLPEDCRSEETRDAVKTTMNVVAILSALVLGLLIAGAKTNFDTRSKEIEQFSTDLTLLDRALMHYGADTKDMRDLLRDYTARKLALTWPTDRRHSTLDHDAQTVQTLDNLEERVRAAMPEADASRTRTVALQLIGELKRTSRLLVIQQSDEIPRPFLIVVIFWLSMLFFSFALFAPRNRVVVAAMLICAVSVSVAVNLTFDMDQPFAGFVRLSSRPLQQALDEMTP